jgi:Mg/Co/Ni transporter MgtE
MADLSNCFTGVNSILANAPPSTAYTKNHTLLRVKQACVSEFGVGLIGGIICFIILILLRPPYICHEQSSTFDPVIINYSKICTLSIIFSVIIIISPTVIKKIR